jgi:AcrR family transcriptional regulator
MTTAATNDSPRPSGRPRDPVLYQRIQDAALSQVANYGWAGYSVDSVAKAAKVGKTSIYRRWPNKTTLLVAALESHRLKLDPKIDANFLEALYDMALQLIDRATSNAGIAHIRLRMEPDLPEELREIAEEITRDSIASSTELVKRGIESGELPTTASPALLMDCLAGAITNRFFSTPFYSGPKPLKSREEFARELVNFLARTDLQDGNADKRL